MPVRSWCSPRLLSPVAVVALIGLVANAAAAQSITGTATYKERMALPPAAVFEASLEDVSRADAPATVVARERITSPGNPPIAFTITYDPATILPRNRYVVRARIVLDDKLLFTSDTAVPVITQGNPTTVSILLRRVGAGTSGPPAAGETQPLVGTYWKATSLAGKHVPSASNREAHLVFEADGRVSGSDGCNRVIGSYERKGDALKFGQVGGTLMACVEAQETERAFRDVVKSTAKLSIAGDRLQLFDARGKPVAEFTGRPQTPPSGGLEGTSWQLVKFGGSDDTTLTPDDPSKYTLEFGAGGQLMARVDCNRGHGAWKSTGPSHVEFGPLALTRAMCPTGSLHDQIVKQLPNIRSYVIKDGHLFLSLMADGGIYEFAPVKK